LSFELAQNDFSSKLQIPQKLYGRENEINALLQAFEQVSEGTSEMMLVAGYSGVGKTALVNEVHKPMTEKHGYFAAAVQYFQTGFSLLPEKDGKTFIH